MAGLLGDGDFPGLLGRLGSGIGNNPNLLMGLGAGIMEGGFGQGLQGAMLGSSVDTKNKTTQAMQASTYAALRARGLSHEDAAAAVFNPEMLKGLLPTAIPEYKQFTQNSTYGGFNPATGKVDVQGNTPEMVKVGPGETANSVIQPLPGASRPPAAPAPIQTPSPLGLRNGERPMLPPTPPAPPPMTSATVPGARPVQTQTFSAPGSVTPMVSGGPEKPPAGYEYVDEKNPKKGLSAIPGGPATHLPAETAGRVAMMQTAAADLPTAEKALMADRGPIGYNTTASRLMSASGIGPIGQANRTVSLGIEAALRAMTGANAPESEVKRYNGLFNPSQFDSRETATQKLNQLKTFMRNTERLVTQGRTVTIEQLQKDPLLNGLVGSGQPAKNQSRFKFNPTTGDIE